MTKIEYKIRYKNMNYTKNVYQIIIFSDEMITV